MVAIISCHWEEPDFFDARLAKQSLTSEQLTDVTRLGISAFTYLQMLPEERQRLIDRLQQQP